MHNAIRAAIAAAVLAGSVSVIGQAPLPATWVTAWAMSQQTLGTTAITNATVRMIARVTIPGEGIRIRLDNTFGTAPVEIAKVFVGLRIQGPVLAAGSNHEVFFSRSPSVTIPVGASAVSDPVALKVEAWQDIAVSLYVPGANVRPSQHSGAVVTSYLTGAGSGDMTADVSRAPFSSTTTSTFWLKSVDVLTPTAAGAIVAFGDSITDGTCTTLDAHDRWEDWLSVRLQLDAAGRGAGAAYKAVLNEGIGGNTITREHLEPPPDSPPGIERLDRDVLSHAGVTDVVLFMGTNDIRRGASAAQVTRGMQELLTRLKARRLPVIAATIIPRHNVAPTGANTGWDDKKTAIRNEVNRWIRSNTSFDAVLDFDTVTRDPANAELLYPPYNCGDGIHPSPAGYYAIGKSIPLNIFKGGLVRPAAQR